MTRTSRATIAVLGINLAHRVRPVLVPVDDLAVLEAIEDRIDIKLAKKALKENCIIPWTEVKKRLELK